MTLSIGQPDGVRVRSAGLWKQVVRVRRQRLVVCQELEALLVRFLMALLNRSIT